MSSTAMNRTLGLRAAAKAAVGAVKTNAQKATRKWSKRGFMRQGDFSPFVYSTRSSTSARDRKHIPRTARGIASAPMGASRYAILQGRLEHLGGGWNTSGLTF